MQLRSYALIGVFLGGVVAAVAASKTVPLSMAPQGAVGVPARSNKPVKESVILSHDLFGKSTLRDMWTEADVVVDAVVSELYAADEATPGPSPLTITATTYKFTVFETFKSDGSWDSGDRTLLVTRLGGLREKSDHILKKHDPAFPLFEKDERYILFLTKLRRNEYGPSFGPDGAFLVTSGRIKARGKNSLSARLGSLSFDEFRTALLNEKAR